MPLHDPRRASYGRNGRKLPHDTRRTGNQHPAQKYEAALNASDTEAVLALYAEDGIFMPQYASSAVGLPAVRAAYDAVFRAIRLTVTFAIQEVHQVAPGWAFARTNSAGTVLLHGTGAHTAEANQELFVLQKSADAWKIARYCFCSTNPPQV